MTKTTTTNVKKYKTVAHFGLKKLKKDLTTLKIFDILEK